MRHIDVVERFDFRLGPRAKIHPDDEKAVVQECVETARRMIQSGVCKTGGLPLLEDGEQYVFHGTKSFDAILRTGFDMRFAGTSTGTAFGRGNYFGTAPDISFGYSRSDARGRCHLLLCRAYIGTQCRGHSSLTIPDEKRRGKFPVRCDSARGPMGKEIIL